MKKNSYPHDEHDRNFVSWNPSSIQYMSEERGLSEPKPLLFKAENSDSLPARESNDKVELLQKQEQSDEVGKGNFFFRAWSEPVSRAKSADPNNS